MAKILKLVIAFALSGKIFADFNSAYVCSFCTGVLGLVEQGGLQIRLENYLKSQCTNKLCEESVHQLILAAVAQLSPDDLCAEAQLCSGTKMFSKWPVNPLPPQPVPWPVERKLEMSLLPNVAPLFRQIAGEISHSADIPLMGHVAAAFAKFLKLSDPNPSPSVEEYEPCGFNISCKIDAISNHLPFQDKDGDRYSSIRKLRGTDWRGVDCDDSRNDVYPGRRSAPNGGEAYTGDHNCNGIFGGNETGLYEDLFCSEYAPRGLVMLGDSATAHFHIPPQWVTANGWNLNGFLSVAENELDQPHCSWGTGHALLEECPYQHPVPGVNGITSLYTQLRQRNRCNHNDFQNIGVNGARMTSSMGLVDAMARDAKLDNPALVWLSLIGNDVCNGHPGFGSMTKPEVFYASAMKTLTALDGLLPSGSHVVSLALFDGELLYATMHNQQHPLGCTYIDLYNFMNDLEENPCWGWLNSNATVRAQTTKWSNDLNAVMKNISETTTFNNFEYIFFDPKWAVIFSDYQKAGYSLVNLIEAVDGFHPSQAGNALFAVQFYKFLEENHPEALGPINPHNAEIDALFFSK